MKKLNILIILGLFVLFIDVIQQAQALKLGGTVKGKYENDAANMNADISKFEGLLNAYSSTQRSNPVNGIAVLESGLFTTANELSNSLEQFNTVLMEVYPTLSEEEQLAVVNAYSSLESYLEDLAAETNSIFGREILLIESLNKTSTLSFIKVYNLSIT